MHDTKVKMKDGRVFSGPIWNRNVEQGFITLVLEDEEQARIEDPDGKLFFRDMESCVTKDQRVSVSEIGDVDEIKRWLNAGR